MGIAIVIVGVGVALAILLAGGGGASRTTVLVKGNGETVTRTGEDANTPVAAGSGGGAPAATGSIPAGRYVQAGSFKTVLHAEEERERLAAAGIEVTVASSDGAAELYPGFQVLLAGPVDEGTPESSIVKDLHRNGVPSAFARNLSPAPQIAGADAAAGRWTGLLERSSGEHPNLDGSLPIVLEIEPDGRSGTLEVERTGCSEDLSLAEAGSATLSYSQGAPCVSGGKVTVRPTQGQLMVSVLPLGSDTLTLGSLTPG